MSPNPLTKFRIRANICLISLKYQLCKCADIRQCMPKLFATGTTCKINVVISLEVSQLIYAYIYVVKVLGIIYYVIN